MKFTIKKIATLLTCCNRREISIACLTNLYKQHLPNDYVLDVYLVDDGSSDGTGDAIRKQFPDVNIIQGTGNLFWNGGMRLSWKTAAQNYNYDFYLLLNDDVLLMGNALIKIFENYNHAVVQAGCDGIITGACMDADLGNFSYGGKTDAGAVKPDGTVQECHYTNGNILLVPRAVYDKIGGLSDLFTHGIGDYEYGLRCLKNKFKCWTSREYLGYCAYNNSRMCINPEIPLYKRIKLLYSPHGLNLREYIKYRKLYWPKRWMFDWLKAHLKTVFPRLYLKLKDHMK